MKWLIESLSNKEAADTFLKVAFEEYQKDNNIEALLLYVRHVAKAQQNYQFSSKDLIIAAKNRVASPPVAAL